MRYSLEVPRPTSFRLPPSLLMRLDTEAARKGSTVTALVSSLLDEGLKAREFPGIIYRDGPAGRRAAIAGGPDVWELVRAVKQGRGAGEQRIRRIAEERGLPVRHLRLAVDYYAAYPDEIDERIAADELAASRLREQIDRRERLMSG